MKELAKKMKDLLNLSLQACDMIEKAGYGTRNYMPDSTTREVCELSLELLCLYIASADGTLKQVEADIVSEMLGEKESLANLRELAEKSGATRDEFGDQLPLVINCVIDYDNGSGSPHSVADIFYQVYSMLGTVILVCDESVSEKEYERLLRFMKNIYKTLRNDLASDIPGLLPPESRINKDISSFGVGNEVIETVAKKVKKEIIRKINKKEDEADEISFSKAGDDETEEETEPTLEELLAELDEMVGLNEVKSDVTSLINLCRVKQIREERGLSFPPLSLHMVFTGNPGTGKTTVARLLSKIYKKIGVLSTGHLVEVDRSGLVGGYVGQTALKVQEVIEKAMGGVLFIDEAYSLASSDSKSDYGIEAIDTLVKAMEDKRDDLVIIAAGYPEPMEKFINSNPGLKSRFTKYINFEDYTPEELVQVFKSFCKDSGYRASLDALAYVKEYFENRCAQKPENFANAREARNLFEQAMMHQANRIVLISDVTEDAITLLKAEDVSGVTDTRGRSEQLAQLALKNLPMAKRLGIPGEIMVCPIDELELPARATAILVKNDMKDLDKVVSYLEADKKLLDIHEMNELLAGGIYKKLIEYGYNGEFEGIDLDE